jgi:type I restriction enzyme M protein
VRADDRFGQVLLTAMLAVATQINLILHGDGSTNVYSENGLSPWSRFSLTSVAGATNLLAAAPKLPTNYYDRESLNQFDAILSNPPFSAPIDLTKEEIEKTFTRNSTSEGMFIERWYQLLKPGGRLGVVLPESLFSVGENEQDRLFLVKHFNLHALVSLADLQ